MTQPLSKQIAKIAGVPATVRVGVITSVTPVQVTIQDTVIQADAVGFLGSYNPQLGDSVILLGQASSAGNDQATWVALGAASTSPGGQLLLTKLRQTVAQNITASTFTPLIFDVMDVDTMQGWSATPNPSRFTVINPGWYEFSGGFSFALNVTGQRQGVWFVNGSALLDNFVAANATTTLSHRQAARTFIRELIAGDFVELAVWQNTAGVLATDVGTGLQPSMNVKYLGPSVS